MSSKAGRVPDYLGHILQAIERIHRYVEHLDAPGFLKDEMTQDAVIRNFEIMGEASNRIKRADPRFIAEHGNIPWELIYTMRNRISHGYDGIDLETVWDTIQNDLAPLRRQVKQALAKATQRGGKEEPSD